MAIQLTNTGLSPEPKLIESTDVLNDSNLPGVSRTNPHESESLLMGSEFEAVRAVTTDAKGRVTQVVSKTYELPLSVNQKTNLASTNAGDSVSSALIGVTGVLPVANGGTGNTSGSAASLTTARNITADDNGTSAASFNGTANASVGIPVTTVAPAASNVQTVAGTRSLRSQIKVLVDNIAHLFANKLDSTANAVSASKLNTARNIQTNLASTSAASFNGEANITPGVTGTLPVANGGTGKTTAEEARAVMCGVMQFPGGNSIKNITRSADFNDRDFIDIIQSGMVWRLSFRDSATNMHIVSGIDGFPWEIYRPSTSQIIITGANKAASWNAVFCYSVGNTIAPTYVLSNTAPATDAVKITLTDSRPAAGWTPPGNSAQSVIGQLATAGTYANIPLFGTGGSAVKPTAQVLPVIKADGTMEVGSAIDFHGNSTASDYNHRISIGTGNNGQQVLTHSGAVQVPDKTALSFFGSNEGVRVATEGQIMRALRWRTVPVSITSAPDWIPLPSLYKSTSNYFDVESIFANEIVNEIRIIIGWNYKGYTGIEPGGIIGSAVFSSGGFIGNDDGDDQFMNAGSSTVNVSGWINDPSKYISDATNSMVLVNLQFNITPNAYGLVGRINLENAAWNSQPCGYLSASNGKPGTLTRVEMTTQISTFLSDMIRIRCQYR